jgi:forkhead protein FKH
MHDLPGDGSPLPRHRKTNNNMLGLSDNVPGSPPVLTSSYMQEEGPSLVTPAPARVHPRLAPPSTAQRPSQHMPTSSPAPFWKFADFGNTPMRGAGLGSSPIKGGDAAAPPSSSPPPAPARSPIRNGTPARTAVPDAEEVEVEDAGFDLTK